MPRITRHEGLIGPARFAASMRPGRNAPDNVEIFPLRFRRLDASMRPGRNAPDNRRESQKHHRSGFASMRPGRNAPDNRSLRSGLVTSFSELQ